MLLCFRPALAARHVRAASTVVHSRLGAGLAKNPNSVDEWRWHAPVEFQMLSPSNAAADPSEALREPADGQRWLARIRAPRRVMVPGVRLRVYGLPAVAVELQLKVESIVADWQEVRSRGCGARRACMACTRPWAHAAAGPSHDMRRIAQRPWRLPQSVAVRMPVHDFTTLSPVWQEDMIDGVEAEVLLSTPGFNAPFPICGVGGDAGGSLGSLLGVEKAES